MEILIAEDDAVSRKTLESFLKKWGHEVAVVKDGEQAWRALISDRAPRLAILDWMMPGMDGIDLCRAVRQRGSDPYTYILLLTARSQKQDIVEGIEAGADDYLAKPFAPQELRVRIRAGIRVVELQEKLRDQATRDSLTGVWNRRGIFDLLRRELDRSSRKHVPVGVIMSDLDHFKAINDTYGHDAGDDVLRETAIRLTSALRTYDCVGRYGGEEFLIFAPDCDAQATFALAERMRLSIGRKPMAVSRADLSVSASFGAASFDGVTGEDAEMIIRAADKALYLAKQQGRNRTELAQLTDGIRQ